MDCVYKNLYLYEDDIKANIYSYEENLILEGYLKDKSGESYQALFSNLENDKNFIFSPKKDFFSEMEYFEYSNIDSLKECKKNIKNDSEKLQEFSIIVNNIHQKKIISLRKFAAKVNLILDEDDFELEYYKFIIFGIFDMFKSSNN